MMSELNPKWQFFHDTINLKHTRICKLKIFSIRFKRAEITAALINDVEPQSDQPICFEIF